MCISVCAGSSGGYVYEQHQRPERFWRYKRAAVETFGYEGYRPLRRGHRLGKVPKALLLSRNGALRLTTARYFTPSGRSIQPKGIEPDIKVLQEVPGDLKGRIETEGEASLRGHLKAEGAEETGSQSYVPTDEKDDRALKEAFDLLRGTITDAAFPAEPNAAVTK
jgi:hypothetical protein